MNEISNILVVDDNQENLKIVSSILREKNYRIALAKDGNMALDILATNRIDLILLDVMMPDMDGFEVCDKIKRNEATSNIPIIYLTAKNETEDIVRCFESGGVDYIPKPFRKEELLARVNNHLQLKTIRDILANRVKDIKDSRSEIMRILLELSRTINPEKTK